jgi:hypothetical protein
VEPTWFAAGDGTGTVLCDNLVALFPDDMPLTDPVDPDNPEEVIPDPNVDSVADHIEPLIVDSEGSLTCEPRVLCNSIYAIVPDGMSDDLLDRRLCESTYSRRAQVNFELAAIEDGPRCGSEYALRLTASRNNDWGCLFGDWFLAGVTSDASEYEGIAFWARAAPGSTKSVLVLLNDKYTANIAVEDEDGNSVPVPTEESACVEEEDLGPGQGTTVNQVTGQQGSTSVNVAGRGPSEDACGNSYQKLVTVTERWQYYVLPFESFTQDQFPNRRVEGIDRASLRGIIVRAPKAAELDLYIDDLFLYRTL